MNIFLSMFVALAMLLGAGADLPAVPETATVTTIMNLSLTQGSRSVALEPEFIFTTAAGTDEFAARFEVKLEDEILLPVTGAVTADKLSFSLADTSHYFSISDAALESSGVLAEIFGDSEAEDIGAEISAGLMPLLRALEVSGKDPNFHYLDSYYSSEALCRLLKKQASEEKREINGEERVATAYSFTLRGRQMMASYDELLSCGNPDVEEFYRLMLESYREMYARPEASFAELAREAYNPDTVEIINVTLYEEEGWNYAEVKSISKGKEINSNSSLAILNFGDRMEIDFSQNDAASGSNLSLSGEISGKLFAPDTAKLEFEILESYAEYGGTDFAAKGTLEISGAETQLDMRYGEAMEDLSDSASFRVTAPDESTRSFSIDLPDERLALSFDVKTETIPYAPFFEGREEKQHNLSASSKAQGQMNIDALALAADAAALMADESMTELINLASGVLYEMAVDALPEVQFPTPEGYTVEEMDTESAAPYALYTKGDKWVAVAYIHAAGEVENYYISPEGGESAAPGYHVSVVHYPDVGEGIYVAYATGPNGDYQFNMEYMDDMEEVKAIIACFCK